MDDKYQLTENDIANLINASNKLKIGESKTGVLDKSVIDTNTGMPRVIGKFIPDKSSLEKFLDATSDKEKIVNFPFTVTVENQEVARGELNPNTLKRHSKFKTIKGFVANKVKSALKYLEEIPKYEDSLDYYVDDLGRTYEIIDGIKVYYDDRGFDYYLKWDEDGNEIAWVKLDNGAKADFLNQERTVILIDGKAYRMNEFGKIEWDREIDYINPHR